MLGGLALQLTAAGDLDDQGHMDVHHVFPALFHRHLTDGLQEGLALDIAHRAADLADENVDILILHGVNALLYLVGHMGYYLHRAAEGCDCAYIELGDPGIPHAVLIKDDWDTIPEDELRTLGKKLRHSPAFPKGANVSFVKLIGVDEVKAVTYERGVEDFTLACGTGCGSIVTALTLKGLVSGKNVKVSMPGGELFVTLTHESGTAHDVYLTGPTCVVFEGETKEI